jgi:hypothetical protein
VDIGLAGLLVALWAVCETRSCCEDDGGRAYVTPTPDGRDAAAEMLAALGLDVEDDEGVLRFAIPPDAHLGDAAWVRERLDR